MQTGLRPPFFISPFLFHLKELFMDLLRGREEMARQDEKHVGWWGGRQECGPGEGTSMYVKLVKRSLGKKKPVGVPGEVEHTHDLSTKSGGLLVGSLPVLQ